MMYTDREQEIQALLSALTDDERALFDRFYTSELTGTKMSASADADPYEVEAQVVETLIAEAEGRATNGVGTVPAPGGGFYELDELPRTNPLTARPRGAGQVGRLSPIRLALAALLVVVVPSALFFGRGEEPPEVAEPAVAQAAPAVADSQPIAELDSEFAALREVRVRGARWSYPTSLEAGRDVYRVVPQAGDVGSDWTPRVEDGTAVWLEQSYIKSVFALPASALPAVQALNAGDSLLLRTARGDVRTYTVTDSRQVGRYQTEILSQRRAGLVLIVVGTDDDTTRQIVEAAYVEPSSPHQ
jgi:hypothetical protein